MAEDKFKLVQVPSFCLPQGLFEHLNKDKGYKSRTEQFTPWLAEASGWPEYKEFLESDEGKKLLKIKKKK